MPIIPQRPEGQAIQTGQTMGLPRHIAPPALDEPLLMSTDFEYPPLYLRGFAFFNDCDFFEAHDEWEELWAEYRGPSREFYQGLIQTAVALHHFCNGNIRGARKLYGSSRKYLEPFRPAHLGVDLDTLFADMESCFEAVLASEEEFPQIDIDPERIPEIHLNPPLSQPTA